MNSIEGLLLSLARMSPARYLILLLGVCGFFYYSFFDDGARYDAQYKRFKAQADEEAEIAEKTRALLSEKESILRNRDALALKFQESIKALPPEIDVAELVRGINSTAKSAGAKINTIRPSRMQEQEYFDQLPIDIEAEGTFGELTLFLSYIVRMPRIIRILSFQFARPSRGSNNGNTDKLVLKGSLLGFKSRPLPEPGESEQNTRRRQ